MNDTIMATIAAIKQGDLARPDPPAPRFRSVRSCATQEHGQHALRLSKPVKLAVKLDVDPDVVEYFERSGKTAKDTIQEVLRRYVDGHK